MRAAADSFGSARTCTSVVEWERKPWAASVHGWCSSGYKGAFWFPFLYGMRLTQDYVTLLVERSSGRRNKRAKM